MPGLGRLEVKLRSAPTQAKGARAENNKRVVLAFYDAGLNRKDYATASRYFGPRYVQHNPISDDGVDIFRFEKGKVVEHWDVKQSIPDHAANRNGMFQQETAPRSPPSSAQPSDARSSPRCASASPLRRLL